ncbi:MAG: ZIP family metal transporter [Planctomycetaceae bacterium]
MPSEFLTVLGIAGAAAVASLAGGAVALWRQPTTLFMSAALGFASGVLLAAITYQMLPEAMELGSLPIAVGGFAAGFAAVYAFDLFVHRGRLAGEKSEQWKEVERFYHRCRPRGSEVTVLAGGTSAEELIEGLSIGVGTAIQPGLGVLIGLAIAIDNLSEGLSIGEIIRKEADGQGRGQARRILGWTGLIAAAVLGSALAGWFLLRGLSEPVLGCLLAAGGGGMFYLTITDLVPHAEEWHYQQSAAIATAAGFLLIFALSTWL